MSLHVIVGGGPVGTATARVLLDRGERVRVVTRSGRGPDGTERIAADATDADRLTTLTEGAAALYNCANPQYHRWLTDWPPLAASLLTAAERTGAVHATASCLYGYGPVDGPITDDTPLAATHPKLRMRADMWRAALAAHRDGRIRATEVRASDYIEDNSVFSFAIGGPLRAGKRAYTPTPLDVPHTFTSITDVARTLVTAATTDTAWGRAWLVPSHDPLTVRQIARRYADVSGLPAPRLTAMPYPVLWAGGLGNSFLRELRTTYYQWARPFTMDASSTTRTFGIEPTPLADALAAVA
ncbi:NAD-dependent epimerase/dehydratase family protein [Actinocatenispora rupis]|uniref:NAD-dependent epimerase n=1 Tax=Actinocatenispora rupis TaxID=519421 RepID=A0A8J3J012_9ACTN|nr:NAD-dependent epimerase/dehydratase family protein [Actinocatenispora rupis]GID09535.1 NAD-dependent epimerase [Actinocatenispora rupis]